MKFPVFDLHCDTALSLIENGGSLWENNGHIDLKRASALDGYCQCFACFTTPYMKDWGEGDPEAVFRRELETLRKELQKNSSVIQQAFSGEDVTANRGRELMSAVFTIEGPAGFGFDPAKLEELYEMGFRITTLGWNEDNVLTGSHATGSGLTDLGKAYVREAQRLGMLIDVSHISDRGFYDIMDITTAPVIASHSNSRHVWNVSRNLTDDMFLEICRTGGVAGFNQYSDFIGENCDINTCCSHILHFLELDPSGKHIALGGDLDGCEKLPLGFSGIQDYPRLAEHLLRRGLDETLVYDIFWNNALRLL